MTRGLGNDDDLAHEAAAAARYGDIARLLRLLGMIGTPAPVTETVESTLMVLADALRAELVCVASVVGDRIVPSAAYGLAADDPVFQSGWPLGPAGREALEPGHPGGPRRGRAPGVPAAPARRPWRPRAPGSH